MPNSWNHNLLGSNLSSLASLRWIFEPMEADVTDASTMLSIQRLLGGHGCVLHVLPCLVREAGKPPLISYGKSATGTCNARRTKQTHTWKLVCKLVATEVSRHSQQMQDVTKTASWLSGVQGEKWGGGFEEGLKRGSEEGVWRRRGSQQVS